MKTKLDLVELGRQVMIAREAYNMNRPVDGPLKDGWQSDRDIYIGGHLADYVEAKLNERAAGRESDLDEKLNRLKADGLISSSPDAWVLERTESMKRLSMLETPHWWGMAQVAVSALVQLAYVVMVYVVNGESARQKGKDGTSLIRPFDYVLIDALFAIKNRAANYQFLNSTSAQNESLLSEIQIVAQNALDSYYKQATK